MTDEPEPHPHCFSTAAGAALFVTAGGSLVTLKSLASSHHYTFSVIQPSPNVEGEDPPPRWWIAVRSGSESMTYLGTMRQRYGGEYIFSLTKKSQLTDDAPAVKAWRWFMEWVMNRNTIPNSLEVWHEGRCGKCGRTLTRPDSIELGIGPVCAERMGLSCHALSS